MVAGAVAARARAREADEPLVDAVALRSRWLVSGIAFLIHEQNPWLFSRAAFLHHAIGWTLLVGADLPARADAAAAARSAGTPGSR